MDQHLMETEWIGLARGGSQEARDRLALLYAPLLQASARRFRVSGMLDKQDLLQEAYLAFVEAVGDFNPELGISFAYFAKRRIHARLWTIVRREQTRKLRMADDRAETENSGSIFEQLADRSAEKEMDTAELRSDLQAVLGNLSAKEQLAILAYLLDLPLKSLADQEKVSVETAKTWRKRAVKKLRKIWI